MAGTWLDSHAKNNYVYTRHWRSYSDGVVHRMGGTALEVPATDNPHAAGTPENVLWATGWTDANNGTVSECNCYRGQTAPA